MPAICFSPLVSPPCRCRPLATLLRAQAAGGSWSPVGFGVVVWAGLLLVSAIAAANAFLPALAWTLGFGPMPEDHAAAWSLLFHNLHYLPLIGTVLIWYVLARDLTGAGSVFGGRFSKGVFALYLLFVPPTSLYHMFLEPGLSPMIRAVGSILSLFISVPTIAAFLVIVASLEAHGRAAGAAGPFGWLRRLPWREPAMSAAGMAVLNLAFGGVFAFVLIQENLSPLLSDTFFVPGYFHFLTVGTVTLTLLAGLSRILPGLSGSPLAAPRLMAALPLAVTAGLLAFGAAGIAAGFSGMPRRVLDVGYDGLAPQRWSSLSALLGVGAAVMAAGLAAHGLALAASFLPRRAALALAPPPPVSATGRALAQPAVTAPLAVLVLSLAMWAATVAAFRLLEALPLAGAGGH